MRTRPPTVTAAATPLALLSLPSLVFPLLPTEGIPALVVYSGVVLGVAGLAAAVGLWMLKKWIFCTRCTFAQSGPPRAHRTPEISWGV